jgi:4-amino-4-deoxy-L-arabinose transferase-like glycosyltransferase
VLELLRKNARFFLAASLAALLLRLFFVFRFPAVADDSHFYADIATNWLRHGVYGITDSGKVMPTLSRLPGYPAFLAAVFAIFGINSFRAVLLIQTLFDLATCFLIADLARRIVSDRCAKAAFLLAVLCPFLADYAAAALTETLEIFFTVLALDCAVGGMKSLGNGLGPSLATGPRKWLACGLSIGACILLRPDGGILLAAIAAYLFWLSLRRVIAAANPGSRLWPLFRAGLILTLGALAPLVPWTLRNLHTLHRFQPLAPRYANDADDPAMPGFNRWTRTWIADYSSVQDIYWNVPGDEIKISDLPRRSFDSPQQMRETMQLFGEYNDGYEPSPELDAGFAALSAARIHSAPLRYYLWLPALRIAGMWLRPRTELLPSDPHWWRFDDARLWLAVSIIFGLINLAYVAAGCAGLYACDLRYKGLLILFFVLRSSFLGTLENPEPRYTLECYPVIIIAAAAFLIGKFRGNDAMQ